MSQYGNKHRLNKPPTNKKTPCNERAFKNIDSEEKAYWLGYLAADGCVQRSSEKGHRLSLISIDGQIIKSFKDFIGSSHSICENRTNDKIAYTLSIGSKAICDDLASHGIHPKKTYNLEPTDIDEKLMRHYIRGYIDGDGNISVSNDARFNRKLFTVSFYGRESIIKWFSDHLKDACGLKSSSWYQQGSITRYTRSQLQAMKICHYIYHDANIFLNRKRNKYLQYAESI